jgi:vacuolar iron transporter family protein
VAFLCGAALPFLAVVLPPEELRVPVTFIAVILALALTGAFGAYLGGARRTRATLRVVCGGTLALLATYFIGTWLGASGIV